MTWSSWHDRLHQHLLQRPELLPKGRAILLAVSGGQDSMALLGLVRDLTSRHQWMLHVWHGNHGWHGAAQRSCDELKAWCQKQGLDFQSATADPTTVESEAKARAWRYHCLETAATRLQAVVATAHTATDRSETLLLQLARGTDLRGLCSLREQRPIREKAPDGIQLSRPMLVFERHHTDAICREFNLPRWNDPTNTSPLFARNRIRHEVMPVLEELYPGCQARISNLSERLSKIQDIQQELIDQQLKAHSTSDQTSRTLMTSSSLDVRRLLMQRWMTQQGVPPLKSMELDRLCRRLGPQQPPGESHLPQGWLIKWTKHNLSLHSPTKTSDRSQKKEEMLINNSDAW